MERVRNEYNDAHYFSFCVTALILNSYSGTQRAGNMEYDQQ